MRARSYSPAEMAANRAKKEAELRAQQNEWLKRQEALAGQGRMQYQPGAQEIAAGVLPPDWMGVTNTQTGQLLDRFKYDPYQGEANQALKAQAFAQGDSPWAQMQFQRQTMEQQNAQDQLAKQTLAAQSQAAAGLARIGGLGGGARTRMAMQGGRDAMMANQMLQREGMGQRLGIQQQDLDRKQGLLGQFANQEQFGQQANINMMGQDLANRRQFEQDRYKQQMAAYGANQTANAQASAGTGKRSGCFITTAMVDHFGMADDCVELNTLRKFRDEVLRTNEVLKADVEDYYDLAEKVDVSLRQIEDEGFWLAVKDQITSAVSEINKGNNIGAYSIYRDLVEFVKDATLTEA